MFISTINRSTKSYALAILGAEYLLGLIPPGTHDWSKFRTPAEIEKDLALYGYEICLNQGLIPSLVDRNDKCSIEDASTNNLINLILSGNILKSWTLSDDDLDVNYIVHATKKRSLPVEDR